MEVLEAPPPHLSELLEDLEYEPEAVAVPGLPGGSIQVESSKGFLSCACLLS